mmetsp:Transcript_22407/g.88726  ORF Transcript_22407/g.88726 Transcript_22407/m.88726 type:complete len:265 (-) Transcript_22407:875-1669(-)
MQVRRRRRRADAGGAAGVVCGPGPAHQRGLWHDREPGAVASDAAGQEPARHRGPGLRGRAGAHRTDHRRAADAQPGRDAGLLQGAGADARQLHRRRLAAHRRQGQHGPRRLRSHHRPREGPVQDEQGQIRRPGAHRGPPGHEPQCRGLLRGRRQHGPAAWHRDVVAPGHQARQRRGRAHRTDGRAVQAPGRRQCAAGPARAARRAGADQDPLDRGQRLHHADLQGQAQPHRGGLLGQLRELGQQEEQGHLRRLSPHRAQALRPV